MTKFRIKVSGSTAFNHGRPFFWGMHAGRPAGILFSTNKEAREKAFSLEQQYGQRGMRYAAEPYEGE